MNNSTICAIATPAGGAIGIIRISGTDAIRITSRLFVPAGETCLSKKKGGTLTFGCIVEPDTQEVIDEVLVSLFRAPHSYTGEDSTEISCHGSHYIMSRIVQLLIAEGCQMAKPGEYTQRAFLNGKMDLSQAEAVADLIASTTAANHRMAIKQMRGAFSHELQELRDKLLHITSLLELELDFSDHEDLEFASRPELLDLAQLIHQRISRLCNSFRLGNALKRGIPVAIVGETNAGKSTLLNALVGEQRALVSNVHGTTRDTVEETVVIGDALIRFIDTAGIRATTDQVERMGIERTHAKINEADVILWMLDATHAQEQYESLCNIIENKGKEVILLVNKTDLLSPTQLLNLQESFQPTTLSLTPLFISAHNERDIDLLRNQLSAALQTIKSRISSGSDTIISNARHYEALSNALTSIDRVIDGLNNNLSGDFISQDLRECIHHLGEIIGVISSESVLQNVFKRFCIGK